MEIGLFFNSKDDAPKTYQPISWSPSRARSGPTVDVGHGPVSAVVVYRTCDHPEPSREEWLGYSEVNSYTIETSDSADTFEIDANITSVSAIDNDDDLVIEGTLQVDGSAPKSSPGSSGSSGSGACAPYQGTKDDPQFDSFCQSAWNFKCAGNNDGSAASCAQWKQIKDDNPTINKTCIYCP